MSFLTEKKAREIFENYKSAELAGNDSEAMTLEAQLNEAGWRITHNVDGWTIVRIGSNNAGLDGTNAAIFLPRNAPVSPYQGNPNTSNQWIVFALIGLGALTLIVALILIIRAIKKRNNNGFATLQKRA